MKTLSKPTRRNVVLVAAIACMVVTAAAAQYNRHDQLIRDLTARRRAGANSAMFAPPLQTENRAHTVYPTGVYPDDVQNVQAALDLGGTVYLKATDSAGNPTAFNFGTPDDLDGVGLHTDVNIVGEQVGPNRTTIQGGFGPIYGSVPVKAKILGIDFESPFEDAILVVASTGLEIVGNRINGVVSRQGKRVSFGDGIDIFGDTADAITGTLRIADNVIENLTADVQSGIQIDEASAKIKIAGNTLHLGETLGTGSAESFGIAVVRCHRSVQIVNNTVDVGQGTVNVMIFIAGDHDARYHVSQNTLSSDGPVTIGVGVSGGNFSEATISPVIHRNLMKIHNSQGGGVSLVGAVTGGSIGENRIEGDANYAFAGATDNNPEDLVTGIVFKNNQISDLVTSADIFLDTNTQDNVVRGQCRTFIDEGVNNHIFCGSPVGNQADTMNVHANSRKAVSRWPLPSRSRSTKGLIK